MAKVRQSLYDMDTRELTSLGVTKKGQAHFLKTLEDANPRIARKEL